jgi:hypothetical protein
MTEAQAQEFATLEAEKEQQTAEAPSENKPATGSQESLALKMIGDRPVSGGKLEIAGTFRTMGGDRPILASKINVVETFRTMGGDRPVFASQLPTVGNFYSSGIRPIGASTLKINETYSNFGNRPIASNQIDDPTLLMGYID